MSRSKPVVFRGQSFPSVKALMTHLGISKSAYYLRQFRGLAPDAVIPWSGFSKRVPVEVDGVRYPSISAYARAVGLGRATARHRVMMAREHKDDRYLHPMPASKVCEYGGKYYRSHPAMDKAPKLTVQDDIYDLHLDMARVYLLDIENAEVEAYSHAD